MSAGLTPAQLELLAYARGEGAPLDVLVPDDAAVLLRAEELLEDGAEHGLALRTARYELAESRAGQ